MSDRAYSRIVPFDSRGPVAKKVPHLLARPTGDVDDPYYWMSNRDDPDTIAYLEAENENCESWFVPIPSFDPILVVPASVFTMPVIINKHA